MAFVSDLEGSQGEFSGLFSKSGSSRVATTRWLDLSISIVGTILLYFVFIRIVYPYFFHRVAISSNVIRRKVYHSLELIIKLETQPAE